MVQDQAVRKNVFSVVCVSVAALALTSCAGGAQQSTAGPQENAGANSPPANSTDFAPPSTLSADGRWGDIPDVAIMDDSRSVPSWVETDSSSSPSGAIKVAVQDRSGRWDRDAATALTVPSAKATQPSVAARGKTAAVAWAQGEIGRRSIMVSQFDGSWSVPTQISTGDSDNPEVVISRNGVVNVCWTQKNGQRSDVVLAKGNAGEYQRKKVTTQADNAISADVAVTDAGQPVVTWYTDTDRRRVRAAVPKFNGSDKPVTLSAPSANAVQPRIASRAGTTMITWQQIDEGVSQHVEYATLGANGTWSAATKLPEATDGAANPVIGVDGKGLASIVWIKAGKRDQGMLSRQTGPGTWAPAVQVTDNERDNDNEQIAVASSGAAIVGWPGVDLNDYPYRPPAQVNVRDAAGGWSGVQSLSAAGTKTSGANVAINDAGQMAATWSLGDQSSQSRVDVATTLKPA